jgi:hypothetical protein
MTVTAVALGGLAIPAMLTPPAFGNQALGSVNVWSSVIVSIAQIFQVTESGSIKGADFRVGTVFSAPNTNYTVRLETVNSNGEPSGTLWATNTEYTLTTGLGSTGWKTGDFVAAATVSRGDLVALVIKPETTYDINVTINQNAGSTLGYVSFPYACTKSGGVWVRQGYTMQMGLKYSDDAYRHIPGVASWQSIDETNIRTSTTPDEVGIKFVCPFDCSVGGVWSTAHLTGAVGYTYKLYDASNNVIFTKSFDKISSVTTARGLSQLMLNASYELTEGETYRLTVQNADASADFLVYGGTVNSSALMESQHMGGDCIWTERTDAGSWTDTNTRRAFMGLLLDGVPDAGGGGGGGAATPQIAVVL